MNKREFLSTGLLAGVGAMIAADSLAKRLRAVAHVPPPELAGDDDFWTGIRGDYRLPGEFIHLENGFFCAMPRPTLEKYLEHVRRINLEGTFYMRRHLEQDRVKTRSALAALAGCPVEELVITRNTTESLDLIIGGFPWKPGDEAVMAEQDYESMLDMFALQERRHGIVARRVMLPNNPGSDEEIVRLYENALTPKTRLIMVCHMVNITGQILPVRKICDMAHARDVEVMVDGAHSFAHIKHTIPELNCDYYGSSLHKWLSAPLGSGLLYVKQEKLKKLWPLFAEAEKEDDDIYRLNHTGTRPVHCDLGVLDAIDYYRAIGAKRKEARLRFLQNYWTSRVRGLDRVVVNTPEDPRRSCAIANVGIVGRKPDELARLLFEKYRIWTVAIDRPGVRGCRITPDIYTTTAELDRFVTALARISGN